MSNNYSENYSGSSYNNSSYNDSYNNNLDSYKEFIILSACIFIAAKLSYLGLAKVDESGNYYGKTSRDEVIDLISMIVLLSIIFIFSLNFYKSLISKNNFELFMLLIIGLGIGLFFINFDKKNDPEINDNNRNSYKTTIEGRQQNRNIVNALFLILVVIIIIYNLSINLKGIRRKMGFSYLFIILFILITSVIIYTNVQTSNIFNMNPGFIALMAIILLIPNNNSNKLIDRTRIILLSIFITYTANLGIEYFIVSDEEKRRLRYTCVANFGSFKGDLESEERNEVERKVQRDLTAMKWIITLIVTSIIVIFLGVYYFVGLNFLE
jgi:hypothetical protein